MTARHLAVVGVTVALAPVVAAAAPADPLPRSGVAPAVRAVGHDHAGFSHTLYVNDCRPNGCAVYPGPDDSRVGTSTIPIQPSRLDPFPHGDAVWNAVVQCVRDTYAPFDVQVVTSNPGAADHFEVMVAGDPEDVQLTGVLGVAPFIPCNGLVDNVPTFVFANQTSNVDLLCWAIAKEAGHAFGLDHALLAADPMSTSAPPLRKRFQNQDARCGVRDDQPRTCRCGNPTQNSFTHLRDTFGLSTAPAPSVRLRALHDGAWVAPGAAIEVEIDATIAMKSVALSIDGAMTTRLDRPPYGFELPDSVAPGPHAITVTATDERELSGQATVTVQVLATCGSGCAAGTVCLGGYCVPDAHAPGGLGASCQTSDQCGSSTCATGEAGEQACTASCDPGRICPLGYTCEGDGEGVCWPVPAQSGGCDAGGGAGLLTALMGLVPMVRRRRVSQG